MVRKEHQQLVLDDGGTRYLVEQLAKRITGDGSAVDLEAYAKKEELSDFITNDSIADLVNRSELDSYCTKSEIPIIKTWSLLGTTHGTEVMMFPEEFEELYITVSLNLWNNMAFHIVREALSNDSGLNDAQVPGGSFYKVGSCEMFSLDNIYADGINILLNRNAGKLYSWYHNENSCNNSNESINATVKWYYK